MDSLYEQLKKYSETDYYPFHMPGHKRNMGVFMDDSTYPIDITEIDGFDNLHHPVDIIKRAQEKAAALYGCCETFFLINGSTSGVLSAISAVSVEDGTLILARNSHKSAYNGAMLQGLNLVYMYPEVVPEYNTLGGITPGQVKQALEKNPGALAVMITSPTYDGIISDIREIARITHKYNVPLIVDEAHGAHLGLSSKFAPNSVKCGADIVIHGLHKTLPSLTQTALLHVQGDLVNRERLKNYLSVYQSSSPSYVLMASIDQCIGLMEQQATDLMDAFLTKREVFFEKIKGLKHIQIMNTSLEGKYGIWKLDFCKLVISVCKTNISGVVLYDVLRQKYHLQMEMAADTYVVAIITCMDTNEGFNRLADALIEIDKELRDCGKVNDCEYWKEYEAFAVMNIKNASNARKKIIPFAKCSGKISGEYIYLYPPGSPMIVPGELLSDKIVDTIKEYNGKGLNVQGLSDFTGKNIQIIE